MNIHEYQAKDLFRSYGIPTPLGKVAYTPQEARDRAEEISQETGAKKWVVKAQVHAGGRGKGGGIQLVESLDQVEGAAKKIISMRLVTPQTGSEGKLVEKVLIEEASAIAKELYLAVLVDRAKETITFLGSTEGGMDIEEVSAKTPEKIISISMAPSSQVFEFSQAKELAQALHIPSSLEKELEDMAKKLLALFQEKDCTLVEINPLIITKDNHLLALDAKVNFDDNALMRHEDILALRDTKEEDSAELEASKFGLSYISLDGDVGCMVNGAGLAMATMDIIKFYGSEPANFLDVGGGATKENVSAAFKIITSDSKVKSILVNIFGGIMKCDVIAEGIIQAVKETSLKVPLVVRLEGTNVEMGKNLLENSGLPILTANSLEEAGKKVTQAVQGK